MNLKDRRKNKLLPISLLILLSVLVFSNTFRNSFIWDDEELIVINPHMHSFKSIPFLFSIPYWKYYAPEAKGWYRPVRAVTLVLDHFFWKLNPFGYHLTNLLLHILSVVLVYFLVLKLKALAKEAREPDEQIFRWQQLLEPGFLTAAFFAVHPIHTESVTWIKNRSDILASLFFLSSLMLFIDACTKKDASARALSYAASLVLFILCLFSKEMALALPCVLVLAVICFIPRKDALRPIVKTLPFFAAAGLYFLFCRIALAIAVPAGAKAQMSFAIHALTVLKTIGSYAYLLMLPIQLNAERLLSIPASFFEPAVLASFLFLLVFLFAVLKAFKSSRLLTFALLWFFVTLMPASNILFLSGRPIAEQRLYIPSVGFCFALGIGMSSVMPRLLRQKGAAVACVMLLALYSAATFRRNVDWRDSITFWTKTVQQSPQSDRAYYNLGTAYVYEDRLEEAEGFYKQALRLNPMLERAHNNLGSIYCQARNFNQAVFSFRKAIECNPYYLEAYNNLGVVYQNLGLKEEALSLYKKAIALRLDAAEVYYNLGITYKDMGQNREAIDAFKKAIEIKPDYASAYNNLANTYAVIGRQEEAIALYEKALNLAPASGRLYNNLAVAYFQQGQYGLAAEYHEKANGLGISNPSLSKALKALENKRE